MLIFSKNYCIICIYFFGVIEIKKIKTVVTIIFLIIFIFMLMIYFLLLAQSKIENKNIEKYTYNENIQAKTFNKNISINTEVIKNKENENVFSFSLDEFIDAYNSIFFKDKKSKYLTKKEKWRRFEHDTAIHSPHPSVRYEFTKDKKILSLPAISVYTPSDTDFVQEITVSFDDHSYSEEMYAIYEEMCFYTLRVFFKNLSYERITSLYKTINETAYNNMFPNEKRYSYGSIPSAVYYKNGIAVYPYFAIGQSVHLCIIPVTSDMIENFRQKGVKIYEIE